MVPQHSSKIIGPWAHYLAINKLEQSHDYTSMLVKSILSPIEKGQVHSFETRSPWALTVTRVSETVHRLLVRSTAPSIIESIE